MLATTGCASSAVSQLRFFNRAPIERVEDGHAIVAPKQRERSLRASQIDALLRIPLDHALSVPGPKLALDINALGEVPRSAWFQPRISKRGLTAQDVLHGGARNRSAELASARFTVRAVKTSGTAPGLTIEDDVTGQRYLLKIDPDEPEAESGAEVLVQRLLWAAGYLVPHNEVVYLARAQLHVATGEAIAARTVDDVLARAPHDDSGRARVLLSEMLDGEPIGGFPMEGVRPDDPNDRIAHQHRRSLRGLELFFAWLGQTDVKEANTLDMWIPIRPGSELGYVRHYQLDFGKALGVWGLAGRERDAFAPHFDYADATQALFALGLQRWPWEAIDGPTLRGVGRFEAHAFDPVRFSPTNPYAPFLYADRFDRFWAAKIIARFSRAHLAAAIEAARYSDPRARGYLLATLVARQRKVVEYGFAAVSTLDDFTVASSATRRFSVCARDLAVAVGFARRDDARTLVGVYDARGHALATGELDGTAADGVLCSADLPIGGSDDGYTMVSYETRRPRVAPQRVIAHFARDPRTGRMRLIGVERR